MNSEEKEVEISTYTTKLVAKLLYNYHTIHGMLYGKSQSIQDVYTEQTEASSYGAKRHASSVMDGKERARQKEELLCMMIDLESGLKLCSDNVRDALIGHFITEDNLIKKTNRGYLFYCIRSLTRAMNNSHEP